MTCKEYGQRYCLIGPLSQKSAAMEVEEMIAPTETLRVTIDSIRAAGVHVVFGKWLIPGAPFVILFDIGSAYNRLAEWKADLWNISGIPCPDNEYF